MSIYDYYPKNDVSKGLKTTYAYAEVQRPRAAVGILMVTKEVVT